MSILGVRLDDLVEHFGLPAPTHAKIDTDGYELDVLGGAERMLDRPEWRSIIIDQPGGDEPEPADQGAARGLGIRYLARARAAPEPELSESGRPLLADKDARDRPAASADSVRRRLQRRLQEHGRRRDLGAREQGAPGPTEHRGGGGRPHERADRLRGRRRRGLTPMFKSTDGGASWKRATVGLNGAMFVGSLAIDPDNPRTIYAGTAAPDAYRSTDGGATWHPMHVTTSGAAEPVVLDPDNSRVLYTMNENVYGLFAATTEARPGTGSEHSRRPRSSASPSPRRRTSSTPAPRAKACSGSSPETLAASPAHGAPRPPRCGRSPPSP